MHPILPLPKTNTNLKFRASARIAWGCMKLTLFHNLELLQYKLIKTCRRIQQRWSSWKSTREGRMNLNIMKNLFVYIFTLSVCKICTLQSEKKKAEERSNFVHTHAPLPPPPPVRTCTLLDWHPYPLSAYVLYRWPLITIK